MDIHLETDLEILRLLRQWGEGPKCADACEIEALRRFDVDALKRAISTIFVSGNAQIRIHAIDVLPYIVPQDVMIELLLPRLHDERAVIRWMSCKMFQRYPNPQAMIPLMDVVQEEKNPDTRVVAVKILGKIGDEQAISVLSIVVKNDKGKNFEGQSVAASARKAIAEIRRRIRVELNP